MTDSKTELELELEAISVLIAILGPLNPTARSNVLDYVFKKLAMTGSAAGPVPAIAPPPASPPAMSSGGIASGKTDPAAVTDILTLREAKQPKSANEMVTLVAYYLSQLAPAGERRDFITSDDIQKYFNQARFPLPEGPPRMTLTNAKNAGYLEAKDRGQYRLSAVGHNLVTHRLGASHGEAPPPRRSRRKATAKLKKRR